MLLPQHVLVSAFHDFIIPILTINGKAGFLIVGAAQNTTQHSFPHYIHSFNITFIHYIFCFPFRFFQFFT